MPNEAQGRGFAHSHGKGHGVANLSVERMRTLLAGSDEEVDAIRRFVEHGGLLVADIMPAIMDGHCRVRPHGALDDVFGVQTVGYTPPGSATEVVCRPGSFKQLPLGDVLHGVQRGPTVSRAGAKSLGAFGVDGVDGEALFIHDHGRGRAVLLNGLLSDQVDTATWANQGHMLAELIALVSGGTINQNVAKEVFAAMWEKGVSPREVVRERGLEQVSDSSELERVVAGVIAENPDVVEKIKAGNDKVINALMGQVMKATRGKAAPPMVTELLKKQLGM